MKNLQKLADDLKKLDDKLSRCMKCGSCQAVCPIFTQTLRESDVARGKLSLLSNLSNLIIKDARAVREKLDRCLLCGSCQNNCPSGVNILDIFFTARAICAQYLGLSAIKKMIFAILLNNPRVFSFCSMISSPFNSFFLRSQNDAQHTACAPLLSPFIGDRRLPQMPKKSISKTFGNLDLPTGKSGIRVLFFAGCMGDKVYTNVTLACLKIFKFHGVGVRMNTRFACCGIPALASGDTKNFKSMARQNLEILKNENFDYLVTACASCTETIRDIWRKYADADQIEIAEKVASKTIDISAFLIDVLKIDIAQNHYVANQDRPKVTYHDSCHLAKGLGIRSQPRKLLKLNSNVEFVEMPSSDTCCGCGGSFTLTHYDISKEIGERKRNFILSSRANTVTCGCPACMMQIANVLALHKDNVEVKHVAEIYAQSLKD